MEMLSGQKPSLKPAELALEDCLARAELDQPQVQDVAFRQPETLEPEAQRCRTRWHKVCVCPAQAR